MSVAPIRKTLSVRGIPSQVFALFTERMNAWWPEGKTIGPQPRVAVVMEPHVQGRWYEVSDLGIETMWGKVLVWEPPCRLVLAWQIDASWRYDPDFVTEVELVFAPDDGRTRVEFEHRNLERFGPSAEAHANLLGSGWPTMLDLFAQLGDSVGDQR